MVIYVYIYIFKKEVIYDMGYFLAVTTAENGKKALELLGLGDGQRTFNSNVKCRFQLLALPVHFLLLITVTFAVLFHFILNA